ncbi:hypothetical protein ASF61_18700 [Duganella sp. Leaf126]|uniref:hypothetical protein n=1 Tax=Duganella sp. Leaf126 TaxID=1736266 RepID=UPI0006F842C6|nr:hypothetical protein [Duganella sp. Leaf126]KQQ45708.1 hypothetical protein ASF61_18700 [Duganella sp. Leaf126]
MRNFTTFTLATLLLVHQFANAQHPSPLGDTVTIVGPLQSGTVQMAWSYTALEAGVDMFERRSPRLAPGATLRYKMPKGMLPPKDKDGVPEVSSAAIAVKGWSVPLPLAPDLSFVLPPNDRAKADNAYVVMSRRFPAGRYEHPVAYVRTPDLPPNVLRLGDLRLACEVQVRILKKDMLRERLLLDAKSWFEKGPCEKDKVFDAPAPYDRITYTAGARQQAIPVGGQPTTFNAPLGDDKWPDDTLITFELDGEPAPKPVATPRPLQPPKPFAIPMHDKPVNLPPELIEPDLSQEALLYPATEVPAAAPLPPHP